MGSSVPSNTTAATTTTQEMKKKAPSFFANAMKQKHNFIQLFAMTGIFLLSMRSLGQKYRINSLEEDTAALKEEQISLTHRLAKIKQALLDEADRDRSGKFASRLKVLFGEDN